MTLNPTSVLHAPFRSAAAEPVVRRQHMQVEEQAFRANFCRMPFILHHALANHPLFVLPRLIELARSLPASYVDYNAGKIPVSIDAKLTPQNGLSIEETIRRIEEHCSWMVIKRVEQDREYNELLNRCLDELEAFTRPMGRRYDMHTRAGAIFISSPGSITPYHIDHECNFLLQIRGIKTMNVFDANDRELLSEEELEDYFSSKTVHRNLPFKEEWQRKAMVFTMHAGDGLHVPSTFPHWVQNGPEVSISFSVAYQTPLSDRRLSLHQFNKRLRGMGVKPVPVGRSRVRDAVKHLAHRVVRRVDRVMGRPEELPLGPEMKS